MTKTINPFDIINHLDREFDGLFGKLVDTAKNVKETSSSWNPAMNVSESADGFEVCLDAPGMQSDAFDIEFIDGTLRWALRSSTINAITSSDAQPNLRQHYRDPFRHPSQQTCHVAKQLG